MRAPTRRLIGGVALAVGIAGTVSAAPTQAAEGSPPVTVDDKVTLEYGEPTLIDVVRNDTDPDGDDLEVCRLGPVPRALVVFNDGSSELFVAPGRGSVAGTYTFTYYACDFEFLTPGTVTVTVTRAPEVRVQKLPEHPGVLRVRNTAKFPITFMYGSLRQPDPDGTLPLTGRFSKFVHVRRHRIDWIAIARRSGVLIDTGSIRNIKLPPGVRPPPPASLEELEPRLTRSWQRQLIR